MLKHYRVSKIKYPWMKYLYLWSLFGKAKVRLRWKYQEIFSFQFLSGCFDHVHCTPCSRKIKTKYQWRPCFCSLKSKQCPTFLRHKKECTYVFQLTYIFCGGITTTHYFSIIFMLYFQSAWVITVFIKAHWKKNCHTSFPYRRKAKCDLGL